ncbi:NAD(P)-binding domain-containing protein [Micromonospora sp. M12]
MSSLRSYSAAGSRNNPPSWSGIRRGWTELGTSMTTVGLIGSGNIGSTLARLAVDAGYEVVLSNSRGPETLKDLVDELGEHASAGTAQDAAQVGDLVVVSVPLKAYRAVPVEPVAGKVVIDTNNYYPQRDGTFRSWTRVRPPAASCSSGTCRNPGWSRSSTTSTTRAWPRCPPAGAADRSALAIAGDDAAAKPR